MRYELGVVRSILSSPGELAWQTALKMLMSWPDAQEAHQVILPYVEGTVLRWPPEIVRWAPQSLLVEVSQKTFKDTCGAHLIQGLCIPAKHSSVLLSMVNNGWFHNKLTHLELCDFNTYSSPLDVLLKPQAHLSAVIHMNLRGVGMTDDILEHFALLQELSTLNASDNKLTNRIVDVLLEPDFFPSLTQLDVRGNTLDEASRYRLMEQSTFTCQA